MIFIGEKIFLTMKFVGYWSMEFVFFLQPEEREGEKRRLFNRLTFCHFLNNVLSNTEKVSNENKSLIAHFTSSSFPRHRTDSPKRLVKKCGFDIESLLKPTTSSAEDTEDNSSDDGQLFLNRTSSPNANLSYECEQSKTKLKRMRTIYTSEQLEKLEAVFDQQQYMVGNERLYLAKKLHLTETQVKVNIVRREKKLNCSFFFSIDLVSESSHQMASANARFSSHIRLEIAIVLFNCFFSFDVLN